MRKTPHRHCHRDRRHRRRRRSCACRFSPGPMAFRRRRPGRARGLSCRRSDRGSGGTRQRGRGQTRRVSGARRRLHGLPHRAGRRAYSGGLAIPLPFGTLYSTNITPDKETGIGDYSDAEFLNAVLRGVRRDGARLYPAMPYPSYTYMTDADALAIKAYLFSLPAAHAANRADTLASRSISAGRWALVVVLQPDSASQPTQRSSANGIAAPISPKRWRIAANATRRAICAWPSTIEQIRRRRAGRLARLQHHFRSRLPASAPGATIRSCDYLAIGHAPAAARRRGRWARRSTRVSVS